MAAVEVPQTLEYRDGQLNALEDFQDSLDDEEDTRSCHEYLNDLDKEYQVRDLLAKSKRFFKKGTQRFSSAKATDQAECHKCGKKGHFAKDCWSKTSVPSYQSPFQPKLLHSPEHKPEPRLTKDFKAKYKKVKAKLAHSVPVLQLLVYPQEKRNELKELTSISEAWLNSSSKVNKCISEQIPTQKKKILRINQLTEDTSNFGPKDRVFVNSSVNNSKMSITGSSNKRKLSGAEDFTLSNHDTPDESSVCSTPLPSLEKLTDAELVSGPKTIKSILKSISTLKAKTLKGIIINEPSSTPVRGNKSSSASKTDSAPAGKLKIVKIEDDPPLAIIMKELNELKLQFSKNKSSYFRNKNSQQVPPNAL
nr:hypothetical protein [Tanacetum cinerariifolium]